MLREEGYLERSGKKVIEKSIIYETDDGKTKNLTPSYVQPAHGLTLKGKLNKPPEDEMRPIYSTDITEFAEQALDNGTPEQEEFFEGMFEAAKEGLKEWKKEFLKKRKK